MNKAQPIVSVIMPTFNSAIYIAESIESVLDQTFTAWELIIVDDNSSDNTLEVISEYIKKDERISVVKLKVNQGVSNARNQGVLNAEGVYIAFLDSDDLWHPNKLEIQVSFHNKNPTYKISHTDYSNFNQNGKISTPYKFIFTKFSKKDGDLLSQLLYFNSVGVLTVMVEKKLLVEFNGFDTGQWGMEDHDLWLRISKAGYRFKFIKENLAFYRVNTAGKMMSNVYKYKLTYNRFLNKHSLIISENNKMKIAMGYYFRYFGILNFKKGNYKLAFLYFKKGCKICFNLYFQFVTLPYLLVSYFKINQIH